MSAANCFGALLAIYYFVGRWTFARLEGDYAVVPMVEQPRFWIVALLVAGALVIQYSLPRNAKQFRLTGVDIATLAFFGYMLLSCVWAPDAEIAGTKAFELSLILVVGMAIVVSRTAGLDDQLHLGFWATIVAIGALLGGMALINASDLRAYAPGGGPNTFGRNMGLTAFGTLFLASRYGMLARVGSIVLFAAAALLIVRCGSRGGLLSFGVAAAVYTVTAKTSIAKKALVISVMSAAIAAALFYTDAGQQAVDVFSGRIIEQTVENRHLAGRDELWFQALDMARERPIFGWGLNGFRANSWNYPHNIFMEVFVEGGAVATLLFLNIFGAWWRQVRRRRIPLSRPYLASLALVVAASQTSGDLYDSRGVFLIVALSLPLPRVAQRRTKPSAIRVPLPRPAAAQTSPAIVTLPQHKTSNWIRQNSART